MTKKINDFKHIRQNFTPHSEKDIKSIAQFNFSKEEWVSRFHDILIKHNIPLVLLYGTCLGIVRDKKIIDNDTDADFGIFLEDLSKLFSCIPELLDNGYFISGRGLFQISFSLPNINFYIDIWPIKKVTNPFLRLFKMKWLCDHVYFKQDFFNTPESIQFLERNYLTPHPKELYLETVYGLDWRTPIKNRFSGPRGALSQYINKCFVDFPIPSQFSGDNSLGTFKPWVSYILKKFFPKSRISSMFNHPK
ncbi:hypothetical protein DID78_01185 [Candidatus Marinamargulisbacteria bacterium SCGC AG-343-D04]|nr:hypothetical protein DID78_01185 [Candidatus Marinamargulisbacteria bacterium SCGC AG-343-D04]